MSENQLTTRDFELEMRAEREAEVVHSKRIAKLHEEHNHALDRLAEAGHKLPLSDRLAQGKIAFTAALDLQGYEAITQSAYDRSEQLYRDLLAEHNAQASASPHSS